MSKRLDAHIARLKARGYNWPIPWQDVEALGRIEDCRLVSYRCPAGKWTNGWGETSGVTANMQWTEDQADAVFFKSVCKYTARVEALLEQPANENQLGALVRLAYNIGLSGFAQSSVLRRHNEGNTKAAARAFALWNKITDPNSGRKVESDGLTARRAAEAARYLEVVEGAPRTPMPQQVEPESSLTQSPIARTGASTIAGGATVTVATIGESFDGASTVFASVKGFAAQVSEFIGLPVPAIIGIGLVIAGFVAIQQRSKQRHDGWA